LNWRLARRYTDRSSAGIAALAVWLGSHALYYALVSPAYSHAASMLTTAWFFWYWLNPEAVFSARRSATLGAIAGLCALMRWQDALFLVVPLLETVRSPATWARRGLAAVAALGGWLAAFAPQMAVWHVLYGQAFTVPQGPSFMQWTQPHLVAVLFSIERGLFTWAPLLVLGAIGLALFAAQHRRWRLGIVWIVAMSWYVNAAVADWWAGEAFGARRFLSLSPLFTLGLALWISGASSTSPQARPWRVAAAVALVIANGLFLLQYQLALKGLEQVAPYPSTVFDFWLARYLLPFRLLLGF
jgi:hypothetical protein